jgi:hypothetical protein
MQKTLTDRVYFLIRKFQNGFFAVYLSGGMDDDSNCEAGIIQFPSGKTLSP